MGKDLANRLDKQVEKKTEPPIFGQLRGMEKEFAAAMPKGSEAKQLIRDAMTAIRQNAKLLECRPVTLFGALMTAAQLGLRPNVLGQCYVIPYEKGKNSGVFEAQFQIGYQGLIELAHRSGRVLSIVARTVYENDYFELEYNVDKDVMVHKPTLDGDPGAPRFYYARATLTDGGYQMTNPMTHAQMEAFRRKYSKALKSPWNAEFESMAHKTVIKQLAKLLPKSTELAVALAADDSIRIHEQGENVASVSDLPTQVDYIDSEAEDVTGSREDAIKLRDEILAATSTAQVHTAMTRGEREGLLDLTVTNENGDDEELRLIAGRRSGELV